MNIIPFEQKAVAVSKAVESLFEDVSIAVAPPHISIKGKVFTVVKDGHHTVLSDSEGNPIQNLKVVILNQTMTKDGRTARCRAYFSSSYDGSNKAPLCYSNDGVKPSAKSKEVQSLTCEGCPQAVKGSKKTEKGTLTTACAISKQLAVLPSGDFDFDIMSMRLPITSLWSENDPFKDKGWYSFDSYMKFLRSNKILNPAMVETSIRFYPSAEYPQLLFKATGRLGEDALMRIAERRKEPEVNEIIGMNEPYATELGGKGDTIDGDGEDAGFTIPVIDTPIKQPEPTAAPAPTKPAKAKPKVEDLSDLEEAPPAAAPAKPAKPKPKVEVIEETEGVNVLDWED